MKKKPTKHFVPIIDRTAVMGNRGGIPAGNCFGKRLPAWEHFEEVAKTRRGVNCRRCRNTRAFRRLK